MIDNNERILADSHIDDVKKSLGYSSAIIIAMWLLAVFVIK